MTIWNLGSINIDNFYRVPHLPVAGETLAATDYRQGLGGKGANMSVAAARGAARVMHIGAIGPGGRWTRDRLLEYGVDVRHVLRVDTATGHANISVDPAGENQIILYSGANRAITEDHIASALSEMRPGDTLLLQNETNGQEVAARLARAVGARVAYAAAPFDADAVAALLTMLDLLVLNRIEADQLTRSLGREVSDLDIADVVVTDGANGATWFGPEGKRHIPAVPADPIDTTGAGDTFTGFLAAGLDRGQPMEQALRLGSQAAAIMVTRVGTADVIPDLKDIEDARLG